jgi:MYXO-CTERM domain-containing protein
MGSGGNTAGSAGLGTGGGAAGVSTSGSGTSGAGTDDAAGCSCRVGEPASDARLLGLCFVAALAWLRRRKS